MLKVEKNVDGSISLKNHTALIEKRTYRRGLAPLEKIKKHDGHMIKRLLLAELGRAGRENICLSVRTHGSRAKYFPIRPTTQSISTYYVLIPRQSFLFYLTNR